MGSKRLKAVAVKGRKEIKIAAKKTFKKVSKKQYDLLGENILVDGLQGY